VAALIIAAIFYGGNIFSNSGADAKAAAYQAQGNQIAGAIVMYEEQHAGALPTSVSALASDGYLTTVPQGGWAISGDFVIQDGVPEETCLEADTAENISAIPPCSSATPTTPCCSQ
jgi:hypothetical protein